VKARPKLTEVAQRIDAHLRRLEHDPKTNPKNGYGTHRFWNASASAEDSRVLIIYLSYRGNSLLWPNEALAYLNALDGGYAKEHFRCPSVRALIDARTAKRGAALDAKREAAEKALAHRRDLSAARDRVIEAARAWARHPTHSSLRDALIAQVEALEALEARDA